MRTRILELHAEIARLSEAATALTLDAHLEMMKTLRDEDRQRGQLSAAIQAEKTRGELRRFYVKQIETGEAYEFDRKSGDEPREFIAEQEKILKQLSSAEETRN